VRRYYLAHKIYFYTPEASQTAPLFNLVADQNSPLNMWRRSELTAGYAAGASNLAATYTVHYSGQSFDIAGVKYKNFEWLPLPLKER
jgi:hypothetical protein